MDTDKVIAERIASEYAQKEENKIVALKKLDKKAKRPSLIFGFVFGIIMSLVLGVGMSMTMGEIGDGSTLYFVFGIIIGVIGLIGVSINYPIYKKILNASKKKYASDIISLAKEVTDEK